MSALSVTRKDIARYRIQEAYQNPNGTFAEPHWDEWYCSDAVPPVDWPEVNELLLSVGNWVFSFSNEDDPRPACRRISEVERNPIVPTVSPALTTLIDLIDQLKVKTVWGSAGIFVEGAEAAVPPLITCATSDTAASIIEALRIVKSGLSNE